MSATGLRAAVSLPMRKRGEVTATNVYVRLSREPELSRPLVAARIALDHHKPKLRCPQYLAFLENALWQEYPPFVTQLYANLQQAASASGQWLVTSLMTNAEREGQRATRLWSLAMLAKKRQERQLLKQHACDESDHALAYLKLIDLVFPGAIDPDFRSELNQLSPQYSIRQALPKSDDAAESIGPSVEQYWAINLEEVRTTIHHVNLRPPLVAHCPAENKRQAERLMNAVLRDELNHVAYTAMLIERAARDAARNVFQALVCKALRDFNRTTSEEPIEYSYNHRFGNYP